MNHFNWDMASIVTSPDAYGREISSAVQSLIQLVAHVYVEDEDRYENILDNVGRQIKPLGARISLLLSTPEASKKALLAAEERFIGGTGYAFILSRRSSWYSLTSADKRDSALL
jgi:hypothetical protein